MSILINTTLGVHKGVSRVYLCGAQLLREGIKPGDKYNLEAANDEVIIRVGDEGDKTVSRKKRGQFLDPVLDIRDEAFQLIGDKGDLLRVVATKSVIKICLHSQSRAQKERRHRLREIINHEGSVDICSLFHGGGVLDRAIHEGLDQGGIKSRISVAVERETAYLDLSLRNNPQLWDTRSLAIQSPIEQIELKEDGPSADILVAGIPCTGASKSGRASLHLDHAESHHSAGSMFHSYLNFVERMNALALIGENVPEYANTASMEVIRAVCRHRGYVLTERVLNGSDFGVHEKRKRLCFVGLPDDIAEHFNWENVVPSSKPLIGPIAEILDQIPEDSDKWKEYSYLKAKEERDIRNKKGFRRQLISEDDYECGVIAAGYAKARSTEPFLAHPTNPDLSRLFTPAEHARIKGIPEDIVKGASDTLAHQVLGQSVIFPVFKAVALEVSRCLLSAGHVEHQLAA